MEAFLIYLFKSSILLSIFYAGYYFLLRKDTFFTINRHYLLVGIILSLLLPFLEFTTVKFIEEPNFYNVESTSTIALNTVIPSTNWWLIGTVLYAIGAFLFILRFIIQLISLKKLLINNPNKKQENCILIEVKEDIAPFSFFNYIVYNPTLHSAEELNMILKHEKIHIVQYHTFDLLVMNFLMIFQWINPIVWLYKKSLEQNLEFIADRETINQISSKKEYQLTLVKVSSNNYASIANNFYQSLIKKRIVMLNKKTSQNRKLWKITLILPLISLFLWSFNTKEVVKIKENSSFDINNSRNVIFQKEDQKVINFIVTKSSTKKELEKIKKTFKDEFDVDVKFSDIERNDKDEITGIRIAITAPKSSANYALSNDKPISAFAISYNDETNQINIGQTENHKSIVWVDGKGSGKSKFVEIHTDHDDDQENEFIFSGGGKDKIIKIKAKNGKVTQEEIRGESHDNVFEINTEDDKTFAFITGTDGKEPLIYIDGKEASKEKMKKLDSDKIESVNVLKGESAIKKYGKKAENGVIEITTKKD